MSKDHYTRMSKDHYTRTELMVRAKEREGLHYNGISYLAYIRIHRIEPLISDETIEAAGRMQEYDEAERDRGERREQQQARDAVLLQVALAANPSAPNEMFDMVSHIHYFPVTYRGKQYRIVVEDSPE